MSALLSDLTRLWPEYYWVFGRGQCKPGEPMYGIHVFRGYDYKGDDTDVPVYAGEHDDPDECVRGAIAWAQGGECL